MTPLDKHAGPPVRLYNQMVVQLLKSQICTTEGANSDDDDEDENDAQDRDSGRVARRPPRAARGREGADAAGRRAGPPAAGAAVGPARQGVPIRTEEGAASLADLFRGRSQLLVYHFMFGPEYTAGCPACSAIADGFNGSVVHLANHDVMLWAVSRAPIAKLQAYKQRMGWSFPWASSFGSDFNYDFHASVHRGAAAPAGRVQLPPWTRPRARTSIEPSSGGRVRSRDRGHRRHRLGDVHARGARG